MSNVFLDLCGYGLDLRDENYLRRVTLSSWKACASAVIARNSANHQYWIKVIRNCLPSQHERNQSRRKVASLNRLKCFAMLAFFMA